MSNKAIFVPSSTLSSNDSLLVAIFVAIIIHIVLVLGMNFTAPKPDKINKSINITLVDTPVTKAPKKANFLAKANQLGTGEKTIKPEQPPAHKQPGLGNRQVKQVEKIEPEASKPKVIQKTITQPKSERKIVTETKTDDVARKPEKQRHLTAESLQQQIAQLGTEIRQSQPSAEQSKIKFVDSVSAHKYVAAQYMKDWERKVERTGNLNYPEVAAKKNFSGTLIMDVGINEDGSIYSIRINRSSGTPALDEAAKQIVRMSAPFAPLPLELRKELDVLIITRVWKFSDESGLITQ
jgi:periplasmic protein TonB